VNWVALCFSHNVSSTLSNSSDDFLWHICLISFHQQCVCVSYSYHTAFLKCTFEFFLMQVLLESCARVNRLNSVDCFDDVYSWCHLCRKKFKWCVYEKSFSHFWAEVSEHMNCHHHHAHFHMHFIHHDSISIYISICDHEQKTFHFWMT
jgi:hypothetical protein